ncbi:hypothetical protein [Neobacillus massiliamazoniensis]|uniref:Uncharacterized protein n=1 Tax=Neobacillus massiliamazoniensis TaxID=1499688 RepID=A0A0U1NSU7_9BACI|nr:hypothetical protein [Neobacillus massiliamazoniensis]CRK81141.1 hypothetical protein BN000_01041 [Neobacillus massiliamazoniensis]
MRSEIQGNRSEGKPVILTGVLVVAALLIFFIASTIKNVNLSVGIVLYSLIDFGFLVAMILGIKTKNKPIVIFSVIVNGILFLTLLAMIYLMAIANGISEP